MKLHWLFPISVLTACGGGDHLPTQTESPVVVNSVLPEAALRGGTISLRILGTGFDEGSTVIFLAGSTQTDAIEVRSVQFVSATELTVLVYIRPGAPIRRYGVRITSGRGTRGIGNEKFHTYLEVEQQLGQGWAYSINQSGTIVGFTAQPSSNAHQAFIWSAGEGHLLPGPDQTTGIAYDITDNNLIVGTALNVPVRWKSDAARTLEDLFPGQSAQWTFIVGEAKRANEDGLIVGWVNPDGIAGGAQRSFCWRDGGWTIVPPKDAGYLGSGVPWDVNEQGDAVGRIVHQSAGTSEAFVLHCHAQIPTITILPSLNGALAHAIADDGTVYGQAGGQTVRWRQTGPDQWGQPEVLAGVPFLPERVTAGGRLAGSCDGTVACLWDPDAGLIPLSSDLDTGAIAWFARDNGPGTPVDAVGTALEGTLAFRWRWTKPVQ